MQIFKYIFIVFILMSTSHGSLAACTSLKPPYAGRVRIVNVDEDYKVRKVRVGEDFNVKFINHPPSQCGDWQIVNNGEDFTVRFVDIGENIRIRILSN